jgi:hypothetical protein
VWKGLITVEKHLETHFKSPAVVGDFIAPTNLINVNNPLLEGDLPEVALPEPATWTFLLVGFAAVGLSRRRR